MSGGAKLYRFEVSHPDYGTVIVTSIGPDSATNEAAKVWGVPWREVAGYCRVTKLGTAARPRCRRCHSEYGQPGDPKAYCPACLDILDRRRREADRYAAENRGRDRERRRRDREE